MVWFEFNLTDFFWGGGGGDGHSSYSTSTPLMHHALQDIFAFVYSVSF